MLRLMAACVASAASVLAVTASPAHADQPTVQVRDISGPAPIVTAACGFPVTRHIHVTIKTFPATETPTPFDSHAIIQVTGTYTGPSGRGFDARTTDNIMVRELADGTLVEIDTGRTLSFTGRVYDFGGDSMTVSGLSIDPTSYCDQLAP
jgi:hypothetical protein